MPSPLKLSLKTELPAILLLVLGFVLSPIFYAHFPTRVPSHWDISGNINGWSSSGFAAFFLPVLNLVLYLFLLFIPALDPKKERYAEFSQSYHYFKTVIILFLTTVYILVSLVGLGYALPIGTILPAMVGALFVILGIFLPKIKSNWMMGVRTPWTLSSETVWTKTHKLSGKIFILSGAILAITPVLPIEWRWVSLIFAILIIALVPIVYSYFLYRKEKST